ncbi:MAG: hypothetical protein IPM56_18035 [Ignavibacteriales bacterium]|nr:MAG: hypothetical protein IPM56_18035 [Ignavibacteriales bacterium]
MKSSLYLFIFLILLLFLSCSEENESSNNIIPLGSDFRYPLQVGNEWSFNTSRLYTNIRPDSIKHLLTDSYSSGTLKVEKDTLLDTLSLCKLAEISKSLRYSYAFYQNTDSGFIKYAYANIPSDLLPQKNMKCRLSYKGKLYISMDEIINQLNNSLNVIMATNDSIYYHNPPRVVFRYPLVVGQEWLLSQLGDIRIDKEVIGKEFVNTSAGTYECFKILWKYDFDSNGVVDDDIIYYEYVSAKGIVKSVITLKDIVVADETHPEGFGFTDVIIERVLTGVNF